MSRRRTSTRLLATATALAAASAYSPIARADQPAPAASANLTAAQSTCVANLNRELNTSERIGQLLWVGMYASDPRAADAYITNYRLGGVVLLGGFHSGVSATKAVTAHTAALADPRVGLFISADQEGGYVQQLQGSGFSTIPTAYYQGTSWSTSTLTRMTTTWAGQVRSAGVNVNLAPVADTVARDFMPSNGPIGHYLRNYGNTGDAVAADVSAAIAGFHAGGIATTIKHFPGLGRITGNTDTTATGITDTSTSASSTYLNPFVAGIAAGTDFVMVSNAYYSKIDPARQAVFSPGVITTLLRGQLGYQGVIITDDIGNAVAVQSAPVESRGRRFIAAGGDIVLTASPATIGPLIAGIRSARASSPAFKARLDAAVLRVLTLKTQRGLTSCS